MPRASSPAPLLLITATPMEGAPLRAALARATALRLPLGEGVRGRLGDQALALVHLGVGKTNTAAGLALACRALRPRGVVQFGIGGAYVGSFLSIGMVAAAAAEVDLDAGRLAAGAPRGEAPAGDAPEDGHESGHEGMAALGFPLLAAGAGGGAARFNVFPTDPDLTERLAGPLELPRVAFGTSDAVSGDFAVAERRARAGAALGLDARLELAVESMEGAAAAQVCAALGVPFAQLRAVSNIAGERDKGAWNIPAAVRAVNAALLRALRAG